MGREWYFKWGSKSSTKKAGGVKRGDDGVNSGGRSGNKKKFIRPEVTAAAVVSGGCMNGILQMFHLHHFHLCLHPQNRSYLEDDLTPSKCVEAPRNSLESFAVEAKDYVLKIPIDLPTKINRRDTALKLVQVPRIQVEDTLPETSKSQAVGARSPTLVARLMGLDILPESNTSTPRSSSSYSRVSTRTPPMTSKTRKKSSFNNGLKSPGSLPKSPRSPSSSQKRRSMNVVDKHRLSLQINKENSIVKEMQLSRRSCSAINTKRREGIRYEEENKSPRYYSRQVMKQVKETVSRRVGNDITNTPTKREFRKDVNLMMKTPPTKPKKSRLAKSSETRKKGLENLCEPVMLRFDVDENVPAMGKLEQKPLKRENEKQVKHEQDQCASKLDMDLLKAKVGVNDVKSPCSKMPLKSYKSIRNKDEQFVYTLRANNSITTEMKCKNTTLSNDLVQGLVPSKALIVPSKKNFSYLQAPPKLLEEQGPSKMQISKLVNNLTRLSHSSGNQQTYGERPKGVANKPMVKNSITTIPPAEFQYISRILKYTGIDRDTPISFTKWFSPSHPLDPTIYQNLENVHHFTTINTHQSPSEINLSLPINRKLVFHLVDEILAEILKPCNKLKPNHQINGLQLVKILCTRVRSVPSLHCHTLQDIDALIEQDMPRFGIESNLARFEDGGEAIVKEIECHILDSLIQEMAMFL